MNQIQGYHISKSDYGIIHLIINTADKWINYQGVLTYNIEHKSEGFDLVTFENEEETGKLFIPESEFNFDREKESTYVMSHGQEKDQVYFYWIPVRLIKGDKWLEKVNQIKLKKK